MTILLVCLFIATLMPILAKAPLAYAQNKMQGGYDNRHPRGQQANLKGFGARAKAAHENCFEALVMFAPGVLACVATETLGSMVTNLAIVFVIARTIYLFAYWFNIHLLRSSAWLVGFGVSLALIYFAIP
ncbi:MAPEG family protein [Alteromonas sp. ASW11-130]|uniref:MAPEG family protein n=1 Tax=Alteromonas sp. ASW11-130 TaxID=3015775 RepID=UPI0022425681|nr:MAPEG family protein [Alteromonas sp. ASW11-130]MCW8091760.1 MAPEG family protein [Alteromonas sp. ASW11-130]